MSFPRVMAVIALAVVATFATTAHAAQIEGVRFEPQVKVGSELLELNGYALLRYKFFFKGYVAALYRTSSAKPEDILTDTAKRLEIEYFWDISASDFAKATVDGITANVPAERLENLRSKIREFNTFYTNVKPGDRYALTYLPDVGTELALNGNPLGVIKGSEFASAIFAIWLGENPLDESLKAALLGR